MTFTQFSYIITIVNSNSDRDNLKREGAMMNSVPIKLWNIIDIDIVRCELKDNNLYLQGTWFPESLKKDML